MSVENGRELYQRVNHPGSATQVEVYAAEPGTLLFGELRARAKRGDEVAAQVVREWENGTRQTVTPAAGTGGTE
ncbi:hypothetical protein [Pseudonocardia sp. N23]|uniref:hypothetical protein n=1 Tax=Pseudonocardia sp. N23 TaxID=1987376 RepID=UPI000C023838|nr:hypothetical protein [Pseudonocardia sp. N23]GAY12085.1 hypothetical protein TOK_0475 [Pseudonocardia sp. N23]